MVKWKFHFELPSKAELGWVVLAFLLFALMDSAQNIGQGGVDTNTSFSVITWYGLSALVGWWIFFALYNVVLMIVYARALRSRKTSYQYDTIAMIFAMVGLLFILGAGIGAFYYGADTPIPYMLNIQQITAYHTGIFFNLMALLYFIVTE